MMGYSEKKMKIMDGAEIIDMLHNPDSLNSVI